MKKYSFLSIAAGAAFALACSSSADDPQPVTSAGDGDTTGDGDVVTGDGDTTPGSGGSSTGDGDTTPPSAGTQIFTGTGSWIDGTSNSVGIQGAFFVLEDSMENGSAVDYGLTQTDLTPDEFSADTVKPCVSGTVAQVTAAGGAECDPAGSDCEWSKIWGGGIGLNLNETGGEGSVKSAYDASALTGFTFEISGSTGGAVVRFKAKMEGSDADICTEVPIGANQVAFSDLVHNCYQGGVPSVTLDTSKLVQLEWQIVPDASASYPVSNFCIESVGYY